MKVPVVYLKDVMHPVPLEGYTFDTATDKISKAVEDQLIQFSLGPTPIAFFKRDVVLVGEGHTASPVQGMDELTDALKGKPH